MGSMRHGTKDALRLAHGCRASHLTLGAGQPRTMGRRLIAGVLPILAIFPLVGASSCEPVGLEGDITVHAAAPLQPGVALAVEDLIADLDAIAMNEVRRDDGAPPPCTPGESHITVYAADSEPAATAALEIQAYAIRERRCGTGRNVEILGGSSLAIQWAIYDLLGQLGIRYLHPEQTLYPAAASWPAAGVSLDARPSFQRRSMQAHRTHPIELVPPLEYSEELTRDDMIDIQKRWIDWNVKMRQTQVNGWDEDLVGDYAYVRGFPRGAGLNLLNSQQSYRPVLDADDPRPESEQIAAAIDARLAPIAGLPDPVYLDFSYNGNEFSEEDDELTVQRIRFITDYVGERYPGVEPVTHNHGTHQEPTANFGVRFYDLPQFAPPSLTVKVHPLMFYDFSRPVPGIYGNESFAGMGRWIEEQQAIRRIVLYPEASWWLTFDLPVPLYLAPATLEARQNDIDRFSPMLSGTEDASTGVYGHHLFTSGQEWGYWVVDYCVAQMAWSRATTHADCLADFTAQLTAGDDILAVLREVEARQIVDMRDAEIVRYLVGSDDETETAAAVGIDFHPLPPAPADVLWASDADLEVLRGHSLPELAAIAADYHRFADRVAATVASQTEIQRPWVEEIVDCLRIFALRAEHAVAVYETTLALRDAVRTTDLERVAALAEETDRVEALTQLAREVVRRREEYYRYPAALTTAGDEPGTPLAIDNRTIYPYRYLGRTHRMFYWERPDRQLAALFQEGLDLVQVSRRVLLATSTLELSLLAADASVTAIDWGDGERGTVLTPHRYATEGEYGWRLDATVGGRALVHEDQVFAVERRFVFRKGSIEVLEPAGAGIVAGVLPGFVVGLGRDADDFAVLGRLDGRRDVASQGALWRRGRSGLRSGPEDLAIELPNIGTLTVWQAIVDIEEAEGEMPPRLLIEGELETAEVIDLLVGVGGFRPSGARSIIASLLGFSPDTLPLRIHFRGEADGSEAP